MEDKDAQTDEISAIKSIYEEDDLFSFENETNKGVFYVKVNNSTASAKEFVVNFVQEKLSIKVEHLPPLVINFHFPADYPSVNAPQFTLSSRWLSLINLSKLCHKLDELWTQNDKTAILFTWISFLADETLEFLGLNSDELLISSKETALNSDEKIDPRAIKQTVSSLLLKDYNKDQCERIFNSSFFVCNVCFEEKKGSESLMFNKCEHVFCNECMKSYFEIQIKEGQVKCLTCPYDKCDTQANQTQVLKLVDYETFKRYDSLLLKNSLDMMTDIVFCPRVKCQTAIIPEDNLAQCSECEYAFCIMCRQGFHGIEPCKIKNSEMKEICHNYMHGSEKVKEDLMKRYGATRIKLAVEDSLSMSLIENTSKQCPSCRAWAQKLDGCNKMTCSKCQCYYCWICLKSLNKADPYSHFNSVNSDCYDKLFEGLTVNNDDNNDNNNNEEENNVDDNDDHVEFVQGQFPPFDPRDYEFYDDSEDDD